MSCEEATELVSQRLFGALGAADERRLQAHLAQCSSCRAEAHASAALWKELGTVDAEVPHERMRARFHAALAAYDARVQATAVDRLFERLWPRRPLFQAALAASLLAIGLVAGHLVPSRATEREIASLRAEIRTVGLVLLDHQSASERLRGVEWARRAQSDARTVDALLETVRHDPSLNVRLAAVQALSGWLDRPRVGTGLADALEREEAPLMQVTLADVLLEGRAEGSTAAVRRVLDRERLDPAVRDHLQMALAETGAALPEA